MTYQLLRLQVKDFDQWKPVFDEFNPARIALGQKSVQLFQAGDDPNSIIIVQEWESMDGAKKFYSSDDFRGAAQRAGNLGPPEVVVMNKVE